MKKLMTMVMMGASLGAYAVTDWNVSYFPKTETGPWDWSTQNAWIRNWSPWAHTLLGSLPSYNASGIGHTANLYHNKLATAPLALKTTASINGLWLGGGPMEEPGIGTTKPILFDIDGGSLTVNNIAYIGYYHSYLDGGAGTATRSGHITIKNGGSLTAKSTFNLGYGYADSILDVQNGTFTAEADLYVGGGCKARGILTNGVNGTISAKNVNIGAAKSTTGLVCNEGTMTVDGNFYLGAASGGYSSGRFDNYGTLNMNGTYFRLGLEWGGKESVFVNHKGAKFNISTSQGLIVGYNSPARLVFDGSAFTNTLQGGVDRFYIGYKNRAAHGSLDIINGASMYNADRVILGYANYGDGSLMISNRAILQVNNTVHIGNAPAIWSGQTDGRGTILVTDHSVFQPGALRFGDSTRAYGEMTVTGGSSVIAPYKQASILIGSSTVGYGTGVVTVVGADSVISNYWYLYVGGQKDRNSGTLNLKGGTVVCRAANEWALSLGYYTNTTTTAENRAGAVIRGYGTITRDSDSHCAYMKSHYGQVIADGEGEERDLDMHKMSSLVSSSTNVHENVNFTGDDGWFAVNKGRLRLPHGEKFTYWEQRSIGETSLLTTSKPRLANSVYFMYDGKSIGSGFYVHIDLYAPDRSDIPAGLTDRFGKSEITAIYRIGCFDGIEDTSNGHEILYPTIRFNYAKPGYKGYEGRKVRLYRYNEASSTWQLENTTAYDASNPHHWISTKNNYPAAAGKAWNVGWYAVVVPRKRGLVFVVR